jgi:hypothetical protein
MTDLLLAVVVIGAVIAFGALISVGNERQRHAIDALHQAYKQWAVQDLRLKRGAISSQIQIDDLTAWLTRTTSLAFGRKTDVMDCQVHNAPVAAVEFREAESGATVVFALESPQVLMPMLKKKHSAIRGTLGSNALLRVGKKTPVVELSILNAGMMFDMEFPVAWSSLTGQATQSDVVWAYIVK